MATKVTPILVRSTVHIQFVTVRKVQPQWLLTMGQGWASLEKAK